MNNEPYEASEVRLIERAYKKLTSHSYITKYVEEMDIDYDIILFMMEILDESTLSGEEKREQILSALLVHAAFITHEKVENDQSSWKRNRKPRQLTVLAGDFYSSLYHSMLEKNVHSGIIPVFSNSIQMINEQKMSLHLREVNDESELMDRLYIVEGCFFKNLGAFYKKQETASLAETFFLLKRLSEERRPRNHYYLSAAAGAVHTFLENDTNSSVENWPSERIDKWLSEKIMILQNELHQKLQYQSSIKNKALYALLDAWTSFDTGAEIK